MQWRNDQAIFECTKGFYPTFQANHSFVANINNFWGLWESVESWRLNPVGAKATDMTAEGWVVSDYYFVDKIFTRKSQFSTDRRLKNMPGKTPEHQLRPVRVCSRGSSRLLRSSRTVSYAVISGEKGWNWRIFCVIVPLIAHWSVKTPKWYWFVKELKLKESKLFLVSLGFCMMAD